MVLRLLRLAMRALYIAGIRRMTSTTSGTSTTMASIESTAKLLIASSGPARNAAVAPNKFASASAPP